jgi:hypothetical protein
LKTKMATLFWAVAAQNGGRLNRRQKVELFEQIPREYEHGVGTIKGVARKFGVHRRMVPATLVIYTMG